jgi:hypothetical protein
MIEARLPKAGWKSAVLPVCSAASLACMLFAYCQFTRGSLFYRSVFWFAMLASPFVLLAGAVVLRKAAGVGYKITAVGAILALPWIYTTESRSFGNSWIALNRAQTDPVIYTNYAEFRILSVALLLMTLIWASSRLLPSSWRLLGRPLNRQTWPAVVLTLSFIVYWFVSFAVPYRQPIIIDGGQPELNILHVRKDGMRFHETRVAVWHDGRCYLAEGDRQLFRYAFTVTTREAILTDALRAESQIIEALPQLQHGAETAPRTIRSLHGEGWYVEVGGSGIASFTTENRISPPASMVGFFSEAKALAATGTISPYEMRDVCLGFCYDPKAGLGYTATNQRCVDRSDGTEYCN